jgi:hypothetical protein
MELSPFFHDPRLMLSEFGNGVARFVPMTRESYARSIFFDRRVQPAAPESTEVPLELLLNHLRETGFTPPHLRFIHHFAHSGSTLLARALDHPRNLVIREPGQLRQLGISAGAGFTSRSMPEALALSLTMLGKRFNEGSSVIVKGNVPITLLAEIIAEADPRQPAILLYFPLEDYCAAVLRSPGHQNWVNRVTADIRLNKDSSIGDIANLSTPQKAAALWLSMIKRFERMLSAHPEMRSLDGNQLFDHPEETIAAANDLLGAGLSGAEVEATANGPLLRSYSKNPAVPFDNETRQKLRSQAKVQHSGELLAAKRWVTQKIADQPLSSALIRPLIGESPSLL